MRRIIDLTALLIALFALTGWIPERVSIRPGEAGFDPETFSAMLSGRRLVT